jgi:hypothetical protein
MSRFGFAASGETIDQKLIEIEHPHHLSVRPPGARGAS